MAMKECSRCGYWKPLSEFFRDKGKKDGRVTACRSCSAERKRELRAERGLENENKGSYETNAWKVVYDPKGIYIRGGLLRGVDATLRAGFFPEGLILRKGERFCQVVGEEAPVDFEGERWREQRLVEVPEVSDVSEVRQLVML